MSKGQTQRKDSELYIWDFFLLSEFWWIGRQSFMVELTFDEE